MSLVTTTFVRTESDQIFTERLGSLRTQIRADAVQIRSSKQLLRQMQKENHPDSASAQSSLAFLRKQNRARQLISGFLRGRTWAKMEANHPEGDAAIGYYLRAAWTKLSPQGELAVPAPLQEFLA
jgi:hypothetical protein